MARTETQYTVAVIAETLIPHSTMTFDESDSRRMTIDDGSLKYEPE